MKDTELKVCQQFHLPVMVTGPPAENHQGKYFVSNIMTYFSSVHIRDKKYHNSGMLAEDDIVLQIEISGIKAYQETKEQLEQGLEKLCQNVTGFQYDITLEKNQRSIFSTDSSNIEVLPEFADMLKQKAELFEKKKLYNLIAKMVYENKTQTEIINFVKKCISDAKGKPMPSIDVKELEDEFENLWKMYPNKKGKKNAKKFYIRSRKNGTSYGEVEAGIIAYNEENKRIGRQLIHIKHGDAWFNGECWNDEYKAEKPKKPNQLQIPATYDIHKIQKKTELCDDYDV